MILRRIKRLCKEILVISKKKAARQINGKSTVIQICKETSILSEPN